MLVGALVALVAVFVLRPRAPRPVVAGVLSAAGLAAGAGALLLQDRPVNAVNWVVTLSVLFVMTPVHVFLVFGPPRAGARR